MDWIEFVSCLSEEITKKGGTIKKFILDKELGLYEDYIEVSLNSVRLLINNEIKEISVLDIIGNFNSCNGYNIDITLMSNCSIDDFINCVEAIYRIKIRK